MSKTENTKLWESEPPKQTDQISIYGQTNSGKSSLGILWIFYLLHLNPWIEAIYSPIGIYDGNPFRGPAFQPRRLFDNTDGHIPELARAKLVPIESWRQLYRGVMTHQFRRGIIFGDEISRIASHRAWKTQMSKMIVQVSQNASRNDSPLILTEQLSGGFDKLFRVNIPIALNPLNSPQLTGASPDDNIRFSHKRTINADFEGLNTPLHNEEVSQFGILSEGMDLRNFPCSWKTIWTYYTRAEAPRYYTQQPLEGTELSDMLYSPKGFVSWISNGSLVDLDYYSKGILKAPKSAIIDEAEEWSKREFWALTDDDRDTLVYEYRKAESKIAEGREGKVKCGNCGYFQVVRGKSRSKPKIECSNCGKMTRNTLSESVEETQ